MIKKLFKNFKVLLPVFALLTLGSIVVGVNYVRAQSDGVLESTSSANTALVATQVTGGTTDCYLRLDGVSGESTAKGFENWIDITAYSWGVSQSGSKIGSGSGTGKVKFQDLTITKRLDKASPKLFIDAASGKRIDTGDLVCQTVNQDRPVQFLKISLSNIMINSLQQSASDHQYPTEEVSLNFTKIQETYTPQSVTGETPSPALGGWDINKNQAL